MSGYVGNSGDAAQTAAADKVANEVYAVRQAMKTAYGMVSLTHCKECEEEIPHARQKAVPGVQFCVECQDHNMVIRRVRMLTKML
jgi:phage/conjugal plasmid C-4 type zinc finger TraR family protein